MADVLKLGVSGGGVAMVHGRLVVLGLEVPASELRDDHFGPGTEAAIERFQTTAGLAVLSRGPSSTSRLGVRPADTTPHRLDHDEIDDIQILASYRIEVRP